MIHGLSILHIVAFGHLGIQFIHAATAARAAAQLVIVLVVVLAQLAQVAGVVHVVHCAVHAIVPIQCLHVAYAFLFAPAVSSRRQQSKSTISIFSITYINNIIY